MALHEDIMATLQNNLDALRRHKVRKIGLFGSAARKEAGSGSDLDFLVEFEEKSFDNYMDLKFFLEDLFGRKVDLVIEGTIKPALRAKILQETIYAPGLSSLS
ncbi:MAG TPA: nucleotidyltransferase family protein [bacterium]|nr:nucleotidyltransferase family protein [bacterium]